MSEPVNPCLACGVMNDADARFCQECGSRLDRDARAAERIPITSASPASTWSGVEEPEPVTGADGDALAGDQELGAPDPSEIPLPEGAEMDTPLSPPVESLPTFAGSSAVPQSAVSDGAPASSVAATADGTVGHTVPVAVPTRGLVRSPSPPVVTNVGRTRPRRTGLSPRSLIAGGVMLLLAAGVLVFTDRLAIVPGGLGLTLLVLGIMRLRSSG